MKKITIVILLIIASIALVSCKKDSEKTINIIATQDPHEEILLAAKSILKERGFELVITVTDEYAIPNMAVATKSQDANFFQHIPFFNAYNNDSNNKEKLVNIAEIHIEPIGLYSRKYNSVSEIKENDIIVISNSVPDHGRFLKILEELKLVELKEGFKPETGTLDDIVSNPKKIKFLQVAPNFLVGTYKNEDHAFVLINGNYALSGGLVPKTDAKYLESEVSNPYVNIIAVLKGRENEPKIVALKEVLTSKAIADFIESKYSGSVIPVNTSK